MHPIDAKRLLILVSSMEGGGAERVAATLANHWASQRHRVQIIPTFSGRGGCAYPLHEDVHLDYLADHVNGAVGSLGKLQRFRVLRNLIRGYKPDAILSFLTHVNVVALAASWGLNLRVVVAERIYPPLFDPGWGWKQMRPFFYRRASSIVMQTEKGAQWARAHCRGVRVKVIPNPVFLPLERSEPIVDPAALVRPKRRLVLAAGRLEQQKGFDILLEAFAAVATKTSKWDLAILGEGSARESLEKKVALLGLSERVLLPGRVGNVADWYERAELFVLSSRFEGFPNVLLEAMAHGLPAVSFDCDTGPGCIIRHGEDGLLVPLYASAQGLAAAIETLLLEEERRKLMASRALDVRRRFSFEAISRMWDKAMGMT